jgi:hypothetical protein
MSPDVEREIIEFLSEEKRRRSVRPPSEPNAPELRALQKAVANVGDNVSQIMAAQREGFASLKRRMDRHHDRIARLERPGRATMPSLSADDSGSIDISALGGNVKLRGTLPVRAAVAAALCGLLVALGFAASQALVHATPPPIQSVGPIPPHGGPP